MALAPPPAAPPPPPTARQLPLPLAVTAGTTAPGAPPAGPPTPPREVWAGLSLAAQQALRRALLRIAREVGHAADPA